MSNSNKKLGIFTLSGLIIGPILGSGIILLPPLLFNFVGNYSLLIWIAILLLGFVFALIFVKLAILFPGDGGVSNATKSALGKKYQVLTSLYLIFAVFFGPIAVLLTATHFLADYFPNVSEAFMAFLLYVITYILLLNKINFIGKLMLFFTTFITIILLVSSINVLFSIDNFVLTLPIVNFTDISYSFLLVFWAIVGWEVIGNYSKEVESSQTLKLAVVISVSVVSLVYILLAMAISFSEFPLKNAEQFKLVWILEPLFKEYSSILLTVFTSVLCVGTIILFIGAVARLISSLNFTKYTSKHIKTGAPIGALNFLGILHIITLVLVYFEILTIKNLVAFADGFFIANALIGLVTAIIIFEKSFLRYAAMVLLVIFSAILITSNIYILLSIVILFLYIYFKVKS